MKYKRLEIAAWTLFGIGFFILLVFALRIASQFSLSGEIDVNATSMIGTFIGGIASVFFTSATIILIYLTYQSNRDEFRVLNNYNSELVKFNNRQMQIIALNDFISSLKEINEYFSKRAYANFCSNFKGRLETKLRDKFGNYNGGLMEVIIETISQEKEFFQESDKKTKLVIDQIRDFIKLSHESGIENSNFYIFKLKSQIVLHDNLRKSLMLYGLTDTELKSYINIYSLLGDVDAVIELNQKLNTMDSKQHTMTLKDYYDESAFYS